MIRKERLVTSPINKKNRGELYNERKEILFGGDLSFGEESFGKLLQANQIKLNKLFAKEKSGSFFSGIPKGIHNLTENLSNLIFNYMLVISLSLKENNYVGAYKTFLFLFKENEDCLNYIFDKIKRNLPLSVPVNNISKYYPTITLLYIKILSCLIKISGKFKKLQIQNIYLSHYIQIIHLSYKLILERGEARNQEKETKNKIRYFLSNSLFQASLFAMWNYLPITIPIKCLEKIDEINESNFSQSSQNFLLVKTLYNLGLLYYINGNNEEGINCLEKAKKKLKNLLKNANHSPTIESKSKIKICDSFKNLSDQSKSLKKSLTISPEVNLLNNYYIDTDGDVGSLNGLKSIEIALAEVYLDCNNFIKSFIHIKKALNLLKGGEKSFKNVIESKLLQKFLEKVESFFTINEKEKEKESKNELEQSKKKKRETIINKNREMSSKTLTEIEKFFIFLSKLSEYQVKILNEFQPKDDLNKNDLPILFSNQFKDCLTYSQRVSLDRLQTMALSRYIILKDPSQQIRLNNINYELFTLKEKTIFKGENIVKSKKLSSLFLEGNEGKNSIPFKQFFNIIHNSLEDKEAQNLISKNDFLLYKIFLNTPTNEILELIKQPEIISDTIKNYIKEKQKEFNNNELFAKEMNYYSNSDSETSSNENDVEEYENIGESERNISFEVVE